MASSIDEIDEMKQKRKQLSSYLETFRESLTDCILLIDPTWAELLQWLVGFEYLLHDLRVSKIYLLSPTGNLAEPLDIPTTSLLKLTFIVCNFLSEVIPGVLDILFKAAASASKSISLHILCSLSARHVLHFPLEVRQVEAACLDDSSFEYFIDLIKSEYRTRKASCKLRNPMIDHLPFFAYPLLPNVLLFPSAHPCLSLPDPASQKQSLFLLTHLLASYCDHLGFQPEVFYMGNTSKFIADRIGDVATLDEKDPNRPSLSLVLVDRALDLAAVFTRQSSSLLDRIDQTLPPRSPTTCSFDVAIPLVPLLFTPEEATFLSPDPPSSFSNITGSLVPLHVPVQLHAFQSLASRPAQDALKFLTAQIRELFPSSASQQPLAALLQSISHTIAHRRFQVDSLYLLQLGQAVLLAMEHPTFDQLLAIEKVLMPSIGDATVLQQLATLAEQPFADGKSFPDACELLRLILFVYAVAPDVGSNAKAQENLMLALRRALVSRPHHDKASLDWIKRVGLDDLHGIWHGRCDFNSVKEIFLRVDDAIDDAFYRIAKLTSLRSSFNHSQAFHRLIDDAHGGVFVPFCVKLLRNIFDPNEPDLSDLSRVTDDSLGSRSLSILTSGFSRWGFGQAFVPKPRRPTENHAILFFITGGITFSEIQLLQQAHQSSAFVNTPCFIASTHIVKPSLSILFDDIY